MGAGGGGRTPTAEKGEPERAPAKAPEKRAAAAASKEEAQRGGCPNLQPAEADVNTLDVFKDFDFQVGGRLRSAVRWFGGTARGFGSNPRVGLSS